MKLREGSRLKPFIAQRLGDLTKAKAKRSLGQLQGKIGEMQQTRGFHGALAAQFNVTGKAGIIAELKGSSPFDTFRKPIAFKELAEDFEAVGATCLSVAVERRFFGGSYADLATVHEAVQLPVLAQDIIIDLYQVLDARLAGADAIMLAVSILGTHIGEFMGRARTVALDPVVQVHTQEELDLALGAGADLICVTNRNIHSFDLVPDTCRTLLPLIPPNRALVIAEGGLGTAEDFEEMTKLGAKGILMGTAFMKDQDPAGVLEKVLGIEPQLEE